MRWGDHPSMENRLINGELCINVIEKDNGLIWVVNNGGDDE